MAGQDKVVLVVPTDRPVGIPASGSGCLDVDGCEPHCHVWIVPCVNCGRPQYFEQRNPPADFVHKGSADDLVGVTLVDATSNRQVYPDAT
jgi:hypothetical protein